MKKFMALVMAAGLMTAMVGNAYAADVGIPYSFEFRAQCKDSSTYTDAKDAYQKNVNNSSIYVNTGFWADRTAIRIISEDGKSHRMVQTE